jgi:hypothetical protein
VHGACVASGMHNVDLPPAALRSRLIEGLAPPAMRDFSSNLTFLSNSGSASSPASPRNRNRMLRVPLLSAIASSSLSNGFFRLLPLPSGAIAMAETRNRGRKRWNDSCRPQTTCTSSHRSSSCPFRVQNSP